MCGGGAAGSFGSSENKHLNAFQNKRAEDDKTTTAVDFFGKTCRSVGQQEQETSTTPWFRPFKGHLLTRGPRGKSWYPVSRRLRALPVSSPLHKLYRGSDLPGTPVYVRGEISNTPKTEHTKTITPPPANSNIDASNTDNSTTPGKKAATPKQPTG